MLNPRHQKSNLWAAMIALSVPIALAWLSFAPGLDGGFLAQDDRRLTIDHALVHNPTWANARRLATQVEGDLYQPLPMLSFQVDQFLAPNDPREFHRSNLLLHGLNVILTCLFARAAARSWRVAGLTAALFACHPLATEAVAWISGRMILTAALFSLATFWIFSVRRPRVGTRFAAGAILATIAAQLCKVMPTLPIAAAWCDAALRGREAGPAGRSRTWWAVLAACVAVTALVSVVDLRATGETIGSQMDAGSGVGGAAKVVLAARACIENYFWPVGLSPWTPPPQSAALSSICIAVLELAILLVVARLAWSRCRPAAVGIVLFLILLLPFVLAVRARNLLMADRYAYLPIVGLHLAVASLAVGLLDRARRSATRDGARIYVVGFTSIVALLLGSSVMQSRAHATAWHDDVTCWRRTLARHPDEPTAHVRLAGALREAGEADEALAVAKSALARWPADARLFAELGRAAARLGRWPDAESALRKAYAGDPSRLVLKYELGLAIEKRGRADEARRMWSDIIALQPGFAPAMTALARSLRDAGRADEAIAMFQRAVAAAPYNRDARMQLGTLLLQRGRTADARSQFGAVLDFDPRDADAWRAWSACLTGDVGSEPIRPPPTGEESGRFMRAFGEIWNAGEPGKFADLVQLSPPKTEADRDDLRGIAAVLSLRGSRSPDDVPALFMAGIDLRLQGDAATANRFFEKARAVSTSEAWNQVIKAARQ